MVEDAPDPASLAGDGARKTHPRIIARGVGGFGGLSIGRLGCDVGRLC